MLCPQVVKMHQNISPYDVLNMNPLLLWLRKCFSNLPRASRIIFISGCIIFTIVFMYSTREIRIVEFPQELVDQHVIKDDGGFYRILKGPMPSVNLVVAATSKEDYSWVKELKVPGMKVVPYIADDLNATHHAQKNKGHEAMMYHQYFYDFYDNLPDISILIHSQQRSWHIEQLLDQSMSFSLNHLDLREVQRRGFLNLRVTWGIGCSSGSMNTTRVNEESSTSPEQKEMQEAFRANFNVYNVPEILATPCCSQIAVTKERIRSVPREQYQHHIKWLLDSNLSDSISGRTWEHMWQYLFLEKSIDCPLEHKAYCRLYHICFGGREEYEEWIELNQGRSQLEKELEKLVKVAEQPLRKDKDGKIVEDKQNEKVLTDAEIKSKETMKKWLEKELRTVREAIRVRREVAVVRGSVEANRVAEGVNLYGDEVEPGVEDKIFPQTVSSVVASSTALS
ncbi:hypothetical protein ONS95_010205 [Cadophora gregata]|uniref:uncharacterized protein n=1 Tax=Cadophora gregata TaxID=51156 RepID=UPI0026DD71AF|nr:uncharacterized protein ONS95_010205 [Cadophora gregata]KAK0121930.1 hypothetical protein ONS95_010205 [Cadophora gregata]